MKYSSMKIRYIVCLCLQNSYSFTLSSSAYNADIDIFHDEKLDTVVCYAFKTLIVLLSHLVHTMHFIYKTQM